MIIEDNYLKKIKSWYKYNKFAETLNNKNKGNLFERFTQLFLKTDLLYQSIYKNVWLLNEVPSKIKKHLNLPALDEGIDLIAETYSGEFHSVQSKYKNNNSRLNYKELSTFNSLSFTVCKNISAALVVTTGSSPKKEKLMPKVTYCDFSKLSDLDKENWLSIRNSISGKIQKPKIKKPFDYQKDIVQKLESHFKNEERGKFFVPCGTGKTLIAFWAVQKLMPKKIIVAVPSIQLVGQFMREWAEEFLANGIKPDWLIVCSDEKTGKFDYQDKDAFISSVYDLGVKATTDKDEIITALKRKSKIQIVITTYQSGKVISQASKKSKTTFDFGVFDEAHKTVGKESKLYSHLIFEKNINIKKRMFMTATAKIWGGPKDTEVISMDDNSKHYGKTVADMTFKDAIEIKDSPICDYEIITLNILKKEIEQLWESNSFLSSKKMDEVEARHLAAAIMLKKLYKEHGVKLSISFHNSLSGANRFKEIVDNLKSSWGIFGFESHYIDGKMDSSKKNNVLNNFANSENSLIANARCLTEGVNIKAVDCVMFVDQKQSVIDIVQAGGRALRKNPKFKKRKGMAIEKGIIAIPVIIPDGKDLETTENKEFLAVRRVMSNLALQDSRIAEELKSISEGKAPSTKIINILSTAKLTQKINIHNFEKNIKNVVWKRIAQIAPRSFEEARKFIQKFQLKNYKDYRDWAKSDKRPSDIPFDPRQVYMNKGWKGYGDYLGTGVIGPQNRKYKSYDEARRFMKNIGLKNYKEYREWAKSGKRPNDIPSAPQVVYKNKGYKGIGHFLGSGIISTQYIKFRSYEDAKKYVSQLKFKNRAEFHEWAKSGKRPNDIPYSPERTYKNNGWKSMGDFLGTGYIASQNRKYKSYDEAKRFMKKTGINNNREFQEWAKSGKKPDDIPSAPRSAYKDKGWKSMGDFLGTGLVATYLIKYKSYDEARRFMKNIGLKTQSEFKEWAKSGKRPDDIPSSPHLVYKDKGYKGLGHFLGTGNIAPQNKKFKSYKEAQRYVQSLGIKTGKEYGEWAKSGKKPDDIPSAPEVVYKNNGWKGLKDFLGTGLVATWLLKYKSYDEARRFMKNIGLKTQSEFKEWAKSGKRPDDIPYSPEKIYKNNGWKGMGDFLGTDYIASQNRKYKSYEDAKKYVSQLKFKNRAEFQEWAKSGKKPNDIPYHPEKTYKDKGFKGMGDFLGKNE